MTKTNFLKICLIVTIYPLLHGCIASKPVQRERVNELYEETYVPPMDSTYQIQAGDEIEVLVWEQPNFNTTTTVSSMGTIAMPLIGELTVAGMTHDELKEKLTQELSQYIKTEINLTLSVRSTDNMQVSVFGMVGSPDNYPIVNQASIFKIISMAGGLAEEADIRNVKIYRKQSADSNELRDITIDLTRYLETGSVNTAAMVYPGDVVYIPEEQNVIRETSSFLRDIVLLFGIFRVAR